MEKELKTILELFLALSDDHQVDLFDRVKSELISIRATRANEFEANAKNHAETANKIRSGSEYIAHGSNNPSINLKPATPSY